MLQEVSKILETFWRSKRVENLLNDRGGFDRCILAAVSNPYRGREPRLVSRCRVEFDRPSGPVEAETEDISARGMFIRTEALLPVGEETEIRLTLPDKTFLTLHARVAHMLTPHAARALGRHPGLGFELIGPDTPSRLMLRAHVDNVRVPATVTAVAPLNIKSTRLVEEGLSVEVALLDGRHVNVMALKTTHPHVGDHVEIIEHRHHTGRITYSWK